MVPPNNKRQLPANNENLEGNSLRNIYVCWELTLPNSTILRILGHFRRFQLKYFLSWQTKVANFFFDKLLTPARHF